MVCGGNRLSHQRRRPSAAQLAAALAAVVTMLVANGLPRLRHPLFDVPEFELATRNRFFMCLRAGNAGFDRDRASDFLRGLEPLLVKDVPA
jgi:hypothetical protein